MNKCILMGNAGDRPNVFLKENDEFHWAFFDLAVKDFKETSWFKVKTNNRAASFISKGSKVLIEGKVQYEDYEKDGQKRRSYFVYASSIQVLTKYNEDPEIENNGNLIEDKQELPF